MTIAGGLYLPKVDFAAAQVGGVASRETLSSVSRSVAAQQVQASAAWAACRILYGRGRMGADLYDMGVLGGDLILFLIWGYGPWDGIESFTVGDEAPPAGVTVTHYDGTQTTHNATLAQLYGVTGDPVRLAQMIYPNLVYSVVRVPAGMSIGFPQCQAIWRGRRLYDPRDPAQDPDVPSTWLYSSNATLALADFRRSAVYGMSRDIDWASVETCADANDVSLGGLPRSAVNLLLDSRQPCERWSEALSTYAECWVLDDGITSRFVPDAPASPVMDFDHATGQILDLAPLEFTRPADSPNVIEIAWTDTSQIPWREDVATAVAAGVDASGAEVRLSRVPLPGIHDASQAERHAIQRLNKINLCDLTTSLKAPARAAPIEVGDTIRLTHPCGLTLKEFRVTATEGVMGDYSLGLAEYDAACYSNAVVAHSITPDTTLPNPSVPPVVTGLALVEENYVTRDGTTQTRFKATWTAPDWPWPITYRAVFTALGVPPVERGVAAAEALSDQVQEGLLYQVQVFTVARGLASAPVTATASAIGKGLLPGNVTSASAFEVGGEVRVTIGAAIDKDLKFYELRYDDGSLTYPAHAWADIWAAATFVDATPAASGVGGFIATKGIPAGDWRLLICALDSVDQYSPVPFAIPVTVTLDVNSFLVGNHSFSDATLTGMMEYRLPCDSRRYYITEDGVSLATKMPGDLATYGDNLETYHAPQVSEFITEAHDFGLMLAGSWQGTIASEALSGTVTDVISLSSDGGSYADQASLSAKANARFGKVKSSTSGSGTLRVTLPEATMRIDAVPRQHNGDITTNLSGATTISLPGPIAAFKGPLIFVPYVQCEVRADNYVTGASPSVDLYTYNVSTHAQMSASGKWVAETV